MHGDPVTPHMNGAGVNADNRKQPTEMPMRFVTAEQLKTMQIILEWARVLKFSSGAVGTQGSSVWSENLFCIPKDRIYKTKSYFTGSLAEVYDIDHIIGGDAGLSNAGRQSILQKNRKSILKKSKDRLQDKLHNLYQTQFKRKTNNTFYKSTTAQRMVRSLQKQPLSFCYSRKPRMEHWMNPFSHSHLCHKRTRSSNCFRCAELCYFEGGQKTKTPKSSCMYDIHIHVNWSFHSLTYFSLYKQMSRKRCTFCRTWTRSGQKREWRESSAHLFRVNLTV